MPISRNFGGITIQKPGCHCRMSPGCHCDPNKDVIRDLLLLLSKIGHPHLEKEMWVYTHMCNAAAKLTEWTHHELDGE